MKKLLPLLTVLFLLLTVTPIFAKSNSSNNGSEQDSEFKNHGQFVSSVAGTHPGGEEVSEAAKSDIGKKEHDNDLDDDEDDDDGGIVIPPTPGVSPSPTVSPSPLASPTPDVSPTPGVSPTPDVSPTPEASPSPSVSPSPLATTQDQVTFLQGLVDRLNSILTTLKNLL